ncbi:hypothetical protein GIB67_013768 [Kingdonia uniflora]|uniref:Uncharacterized protein n=1 Tax=Kingdonia uniflora TaxID=39325 RepID=A0A7J7MND3_9MAGN|nr:hypothetical protein GIB67_013768 [Kingdonia uniflora]
MGEEASREDQNYSSVDRGSRFDKSYQFQSTNSSSPSPILCPRVIIGVIDDNGLFFGAMKFAGTGGSLSAIFYVGVEKSSISLLSTIPVEGASTPAPKA